tara:strand:- start:488 stop:808 length:321 start_codon:yes stop_codon:yes gene_type:complete
VKTKPQFIAKLKYKTAETGGRKTPANSGYRPQIQFGFTDKQTSGSQKFLDKEKVNPGETVTAEISVLTPQLFENKLDVGMNFQFLEDFTIIGFGSVLDILDKTLEK